VSYTTNEALVNDFVFLESVHILSRLIAGPIGTASSIAEPRGHPIQRIPIHRKHHADNMKSMRES